MYIKNKIKFPRILCSRESDNENCGYRDRGTLGRVLRRAGKRDRDFSSSIASCEFAREGFCSGIYISNQTARFHSRHPVC